MTDLFNDDFDINFDNDSEPTYEVWALYLTEDWLQCAESEEQFGPTYKNAEDALNKAKYIYEHAENYFPKTVLPADCKYINLVVETVVKVDDFTFENIDTIFEKTLEVSDHNEVI